MMKQVFPAEWRTQARWKRRFYAKYMRALERAGYALVLGVFAAFVAAFNVKVEDLATADKVAIVPFARPLAAAGPTLVVRALAHDLDAVRANQPLLEVVVGEDAIRRYGEWEAVQRLPNEPALIARYPRPATVALTAPADGTFRLDAKEGATVEDKALLGRVVDYGDLRVEASLTGDTVPQASAASPARIVDIAIEPLAETLFRGGGAVSGRILGDRVKAAMEKDLVGREVALRDDVPLRVKEVSEVQVDAAVTAQSADDGSGAVALDPPPDLRIAAQVVEGSPSATVQVGDLPPAVAADVRESAAAGLRGRTVRRADGSLATFGDPREIHAVVKLKAGPGDGSGAPIPGTVLSRSFDAKLKLVSPPAFLMDAVREADRTGKGVTCRVELKTGERPIALRLLKKS